jgi:hypothetical protein
MSGGLRVDDYRSLTQEELKEFIRLERFKSQKSLFYFTRAILGFRKLTPYLHKKVCDFIQDPRYKRKLLLLPRGHYKSTIATIAYPLWLLIQEDIRMLPVNGSLDDPERAEFFRLSYPEPGRNLTILIANETATGAQHFLDAIKTIIETNQLLQLLFPEIIPDFSKQLKRWNQQEMLVPRSVSRPEATIETIGVGGAVQGRHYRVQIHDDLIGNNAMNSDAVMRLTKEWLTYSESLFVNPTTDVHVIVGTRWARNDIYETIKKDPRYKVLEIPALVDGKPIFPEEFSVDFFNAVRAKDPFYFRSQYMNDPRDPFMQDLDSTKLGRFSIIERGETVKIVIQEDGYTEVISSADCSGAMALDPAGSEFKRQASQKAIVVSLRDSKGRTFVVDGWVSYGSHDEMFDAVFRLYNKWKFQLGVETAAFQKFLVWAFRKEEQRRRQWIPIVELPPNTRLNKADRIRSLVQNDLNLGLIYICSEGPMSSVQIGQKLLDEIEGFPEGKLDVIDAFAYTMQMLSELTPMDEEEADNFRRQIELDIMKRSMLTGY